MITVEVLNNDVVAALKRLKKKLGRDGLFRERQRHIAYEGRGARRRRKDLEALKRNRKVAANALKSTNRPATREEGVR
jgi:ribosomal protein S21